MEETRRMKILKIKVKINGIKSKTMVERIYKSKSSFLVKAKKWIKPLKFDERKQRIKLLKIRSEKVIAFTHATLFS